MAASSRMLFKDVVAALDPLTIEKTEKLVVLFGVELKTVQDIEYQRKGSNCKHHFIQAWLDQDTQASWGKLVSGLQHIKMDSLAEQVASQRCLPSPAAASPSTVDHQPVTVRSVATPAPAAPSPPPPPPHPLPSTDPNQPTSPPPSDRCQPVAPPATASATGSDEFPVPSSSTTSSSPPVPPPPSLHNPSTHSFLSPEKVKATIQELEAKFLDLNTDAEEEICEKEAQDQKFLRKFRKYLQLLPAAKKAPHVKFFRECEKEILSAKDSLEILAIICRYIDYRNYEILRDIVLKFCGPPLQTSMQDYCKMLEVFETSTTVDVYISTVPDEVTEDQKKAFSEMVVKIDKPASQCTLHDVRKLNEAIIANSGLCPHSVYISGVANKCVEVVVRFPPSVVGWVLAALTPHFMTTHHLSEVTVDGSQLTLLQDHRHLNDELIRASSKEI
ncbi:hypothetical protein GBAR_LOCUS26209 [Geodia barretti]|uniref:Death domain-containing protein n=1 Tax=Geodia barretti TaxID=519541 RepID=A0AA35TGA9_GEOBA|nr:hypothetical protein GBAR_LOCUS26209 [Geodia barretti]